jgi:NAD(P)-dependent dehydrogenase (short-subunit alcohol dehydrogenase family)
MSMNRVAVITGGGTGVGRAVALECARQGWTAVIVGRRADPLDETVEHGHGAAGRIIMHVADVSDERAVRELAQRVERELGTIGALVNSAGVNIARRHLADLTAADFRKLVEVNLVGAFLCVHAFLPMMRRAGGGTIVNVNSVAGLRANPVSGAAYTASKFGLRGLTQTVNIEERKHGIRACDIFPGEINTPLMDARPKPPTPEQRANMLQPEDLAACVMLVLNLPGRAVVEEITIRPGHAEI